MNDERLGPLLDAFHDLQRPWVVEQWLVIFACIAFAWLLSRMARRSAGTRAERYIARDPERNQALLRARYAGLELLFWPAIAWVLMFGSELAMRARGDPTHLVHAFSVIAFAFVAIGLGLYAMRRVFKPTPGMLLFERWFGLIVWIFVALDVLGLLPDVISVLSGPDATVTIGKNLSISVWQVVSAAFWVAITLVAALWASTSLEARLMRSESVDSSLRIVFARLGQAVLVVIAVLVAMRLVDIDLTVLSVFGGALGVGLGLGLQRIASNYVSGFIILLDRSVRLGDVITIDKYNGSVTEIRTRCTVVRAANGVEALVPNELLLNQAVQNFSDGDKRGNVATRIRIAYDSDVDRAMALMRDAARGHARTLDDPPVDVMLSEFGVDGIELALSFWVADPEKGTDVMRSDVNRAIWTAFVEAGVRIPAARREARFENEAHRLIDDRTIALQRAGN